MKKQFVWVLALVALLNVASAFADTQDEDVDSEVVVIEEVTE